MRIAILIDELAPGSAPKVIGQTVRRLKELGHSCQALVLIATRQQSKFPQIYDYHLSGVNIRYIFGRRPWWDFKLPGFSFFSLHHILSFFVSPLVIKHKEYDFLIANCQYSAFAAWGLKLFRSIPYILYIHCDPGIHTLRKTYLKTWLGFFYPLLYVLALFLDWFAIQGAKVSITSGHLHRKRFSRVSNKPLENLSLGCFHRADFVPYSQRQKAILSYDRWDIGNKPYIFLDLLENIDKDIKVKIAGFWHPEAMKYNFLREIKKRNLENRVELLGPLDEEGILELCPQVMLHLHPNQEAFGMQTLEAAGCGCCIIIPKGSGVADLFEHGKHGYFPEENNLSELVKYVKIVFSDIAKAEEMGRRAWEVAKNYSWANYAKSLERIIKKYV